MSRDTESEYRSDVIYEVWRNGGNPDLVSYDRVADYFYNDVSIDGAASAEIRRQRPSEPEYETDEDFYQGIPYQQ